MFPWAARNELPSPSHISKKKETNQVDPDRDERAEGAYTSDEGRHGGSYCVGSGVGTCEREEERRGAADASQIQERAGVAVQLQLHSSLC